MARSRKPNPWTPSDLKVLRKLARREPVRRIAKQLKRSEAAVRFKAHTLRMSLALRSR